MSDLDYKIKYITSVLDVDFTGTTDEEKQVFINKYWGITEKVIARRLDEEYQDMVKEGVPNE